MVVWKGRVRVICSVVELVALAVWVGGLLVIVGAVIPSVFNVGMETGGRMLTRVFAGYNRLVLGSIVFLVGTSSWRLWAFRDRSTSPLAVTRGEMILLTVMIAIAAAISLWLGPDSAALQERAFAAEGVEAKRAAYEAFFRSHSIVRALYLLNLGLGIGLLAVKVKQWIGGATG